MLLFSTQFGLQIDGLHSTGASAARQKAEGLLPPNKASMPNCPCLYKSVAEERQARQNAVSEQIRVFRAKLPLLLTRLSKIKDPRNPNKIKQDCEQKVFKRLAKRLKDAFGHLPIMVRQDGLYPMAPLWNYTIRTIGIMWWFCKTLIIKKVKKGLTIMNEV